MKQKIKQYLNWFKKGVFYAFVVITVLDIGLMFYFKGSEFKTIGYKISSYSRSFLPFLILFWIGYMDIFFGKISWKKRKNKYMKPLGFLGLLTSVLGFIGIVFVFFILTLLTVIGLEEDRCMERCVTENWSDYDTCLFSICD